MEDTNITNAAEELKQEEAQQPEGEKKPEGKGLVLTSAQEELEKLRKVILDTNEIIKTGMGRLRLEKPIRSRDHDVNELVYDFTDMTGIEYTEAMDGGLNAGRVYDITYRQALSLFAKAAAKQTDDVDAKDILEQIGMTDALEAVQLATLFFNASTQAGRMRISRR